MRRTGVMRGLALALWLTASATIEASGQRPDTVEVERVVVEKNSEPGYWTATWRLSAPTRELRFERPAGGFRARVFEVLTQGYVLGADGEVEVLRTDGEPRSGIRVRFPEYDAQLPREYEFFRRFTDGGVAIYTGHLVARPISDDSGERAHIRSFTFVPPPGAAVLVMGRVRDGPIDWRDPHGRGTYAYVGTATPAASADVVSILDPGLPEWLERRTARALTRLFGLYRSRLGAEPSARPLVLFDYDPGEGSGYSYGGGTLPGLIQLGVEGRDWETESPAAESRLLHFLAHEAAHVWNGEIVHYPGSDDAWMHEGSADGLAQRALLELGLLESRAFLDHQTEALNDCLTGLAAGPLRPSARQGRPRLAYTCGNMIGLLTESSLVDEAVDLFDFWRGLIARARAGDGTYDTSDYLLEWEERGASAADRTELEAFLNGTMTPQRLVSVFRARGIGLEPAEPPPAVGVEFAREALTRVMASDCGGRVGFRVHEDGLRLDPEVSCDHLVAGAIVTGFGGYPVATEGHRAYDRVRAACVADRPILVNLLTPAGEMESVDLPCDYQLPPRTPFLRLVTWFRPLPV